MRIPIPVTRRLPLIALCLASAALGMFAGATPDASAQTVVPAIDWSMPPRLADHDGDGFIDSSILPSLVDSTCGEQPPGRLALGVPCHPEARNFVAAVDGFTVNLNGCGSTGSIATYRWFVEGTLIGESPACDGVSWNASREGVYPVTLEVLPAGGGAAARLTDDVTVQDWLVIAFGDSYGSGEGAPDEPSLLVQIATDIGAAWQDWTAYLEGAASDCLAIADLPGDTIVTLSDALVNEGIDGFLSALAEAFETGTETIETCGWGILDFGSKTTEFFASFIAAFDELDNELFEPITSLTLSDLWPSPLDTLSTRLSEVGDNLLAAMQPVWQDETCHRSSHSGQVQAALKLENDDPRTSVTLVHLACSGATIGNILGIYEEPPGCDPNPCNVPPQIEDAASVVGDREIDAILVSIGGNDIGFADIIEACIIQEPCDASSDIALALDEQLAEVCGSSVLVLLEDECREWITGLKDLGETTGIEISEPGLAALPQSYATLATELEGLLARQAQRASLTAPDSASLRSRILISEYPNATRDDAGGLCGFNIADGLLSESLRTLPFVTDGEFAWAETGVSQRLNDIIAALADDGLTPVAGIFEAFAPHGYCADQHWLVRLQESFMGQLNEFGSVHPNRTGYLQQAAPIAAALRDLLYSEGDLGSPSAPLAFQQVDGARIHEFPVFGEQALSAFGGAVAIDGDVLVVGDTRYKGDSAVDGAAIVFRFDGTRWVREAVFQLPPGQTRSLESFGLDVDVSGDWIAVGAPAGNESDDGEGATFLYQYDGSQWTFRKAVGGSDEFDHSAISLKGDLLAVGRPRTFGGVTEAGNFTDTGAVRLYARDGLDWLAAQDLVPDKPQFNCVGSTLGFFGWDLELADGALAVSSPRHAERVYLIRQLRSGVWACIGTSIDPRLGNPGWSVSFDGRRAVFGSPLSHREGKDFGTGSVFVFRDAGSLVTDGGPEFAIAAIARKGGDRVGDAVAVRGDQILVGAPGADSFAGAENTGAAYLVRRAGAGWVVDPLPVQPTTEIGEQWGSAVAIGARGIVVSAPGKTQTDIDSGVVMVYRNEVPDTALIVDWEEDIVDDAPGDGICATADGHCTLRAAVQEANARAGADAIAVRAGTYELSLLGADEQEAATGDLDIHEDLTIIGLGDVVIDGLMADRVFDTWNRGAVVLKLRGMTIQNGFTPDQFEDGGGVNVREGSLILENMVVRGNHASDNGGGVYVFRGDALVVRDSLFEGNSTERRGGALAGNVTTTVERTRITDNRAGEGGGIHISDAPLFLTASTVDFNTAATAGGGVRTFRAPATIENSTISGNRTETSGQAGGAELGDGSVVRYSTIAASEGTGLSGPLNSVTVESTIIAGNSDQDCETFLFTVVPIGGNIDTDGTCGFDRSADPQLQPLAHNGGPTPTHALAASSPAINASTGDCPVADQRAILRPQGSFCDLGAFELIDPPEGIVAGVVEQTLEPGFNQIGWIGPSTPVEDAFAALGDDFLGAWVWDPDAAAFLSFTPGAPSFLNTLETLEYAAGVWVLSGASASALTLPALTPGAPEVPDSIALRSGFNLIAWPGSEAAPGFGDRRKDPVDDIFASLGDSLLGVWQWDATAASFLIYRPDLPAALNSLQTLEAGSAVWVLVDKPGELFIGVPNPINVAMALP